MNEIDEDDGAAPLPMDRPSFGRMVMRRILGSVVGFARVVDPNAFPGFPPYYVRQPYPAPRFELDYVAAASQVPIVYACVDAIAEDLAGLPTRFYEVAKDGSREEIQPQRGNVAYLFAHPNAVDTPFTLKRALWYSLCITGNGALFIDTFQSDPMTPTPLWELWSMPGHVVKVCVDERRRPVAYEWLGGIAPQLMDARQVIYIPHGQPNFEPRGMSPLEPARTAYETRFLMGLWNREFYSKGAQVAGVWSMQAEGGKTLTPTEAKRVKESLRRLNSGVKWAWDPVIVQNLKYERAGLTHKDMGYLETLEWTDSDICRAFKIPPVVLGIKKGGGLSDAGAKADLLLYYEKCLIPRARLMDAALTAHLCSRWGDNIVAETDFSGVMALQSEKLEQMKSIVIATGRPVLDVDEGRGVAGFAKRQDADEEADVLYQPATIDIGKPGVGPGAPAGEAPATPPQAPGAADEPGAERARRVARERARQAKRATARRRGAAQIETYRRRFEREFRRIFTAQEHRVLARLRHEFELKGLALDASAATNGSRDHLKRLDLGAVIDEGDNVDVEALEALFARLIQERGEDQLAELGVEIEVALLNARTTRYIQHSGTRVLDEVNATTGKRLRDAFAEVAAAGGTYQDYVAAVNETFDGRRGNATNIARTETTGAYNFASLNAAKESGIAAQKYWLTAEDELVREAHQQAEDDGPIGLDEAWTMEGREGPVEVRFPGDPDAPPELVCNCRCVQGFETVNGDEADAPDDGERAAPRASREMREWFAGVGNVSREAL